MTINENSLLAVMNPATLLAGLAVLGAIAYFCARRYRNTNDFAKSVRMYLPLMLAADVVFYILEIPVILLLGIDVAGFVIMALVSNHYFYH